MESYVSNMSGLEVGHLVAHSRAVDVFLFRDQLFKMKGDVRGVQIVCQKGKLWVTQAGDPEDYVLKDGDLFTVTRPGLVVIQGVREGKARIIPRALGQWI